MPKIKSSAKKIESDTEKSLEKKMPSPDELDKIIGIDADIKDVDIKDGDIELMQGEVSEDDPEDDEVTLDEDDIDPFKDKWEE